jgi:FMN phosphatase YigB (HAD superfamily)
MKTKFVDAVGFDLDNTLYRETQEVKDIIMRYILTKASSLLEEPVEAIKPKYQQLYLASQSARQSLEALGIPGAALLVQEALEQADVARILPRDERLVSLFDRLQKDYCLFLITGSSERQSLRKLQALGLEQTRFAVSLYAGSPYTRYDGTAFTYIASTTIIPLHRLFFIGDREQADIIPAKKLGIKTAIVHGTSTAADYQLEAIYDLERILLSS